MFLKSTAIFSILTFLSRIFGFVRDVLMANYFGISAFADAFTVAFRLPNFFRNIFAEGAFSAAFVPMFNGILSTEGREKALEFAGNILQVLVFTLVVLIVLFEIFMPFAVMGLAPGFESNDYKMNLTVYLTRITTPYLLFVSLVTFYASILNSFGRFASMAFSPIILNIVMIGALYFFGNNEIEKVEIAAWSVFVGGIFQLIFILPSLAKRNLWPKLSLFKMNESTKRFFKNLGPAALSSGVVQINLWVGTIIATTIPGAAAAIYYVDRLVQLPIALIGVSIGIVILPSLSRSFKAKNTEAAIHLQNRAMELSLLLSIPCAIALTILAEPIIVALFQRGEFKASDTANIVPALVTLAVGIPAYVMNKIMVPAFFAKEDMRTPLNISIACLILNTTGNLVLVQYIGFVGITLATSITAWINIAMLVYFSYKKEFFKLDEVFISKSIKIALASIVLYVCLIITLHCLTPYLYCSTMKSCAALATVIMLSGGAYLCFLYLTKAYTMAELRALL